MPAMLAQDMEAINKYIMEKTPLTPEAKAVQVEWIKFWKEHQKSILWYSQDEFDQARNIKRNFDLANAISSAEKAVVENHYASGITSEETKGGVRRSTSEGVYIVDEEPFLPTRVKVAGLGILALLGIGYVGVKYYNFTSPTTYLRKALMAPKR